MSRVLIVGATGLIGSHVAAALAEAGYGVTGVARNVSAAARAMPTMNWIALDMARASSAQWEAALAGVDVVVNCAGALQNGPADDVVGAHERGLAALVAACEAADARRFIHFSAMGVDKATPTAFSRSKRAGDDGLRRSRLDWVILRPSVVLGPAAYGASALIRGLAALPVLPVMPATAPLQPVALEDVVGTVLFFAAPRAPVRHTLELAGPDRLSFTELVRLYRGWLGHRPAREMNVPGWLAGLLYRLGDAVGRLGWRPPIRSTAQREIARGAVGDAAPWQRITGIVPRSILVSLAIRPASVQEKWFAGFYLLKPVILVSLALFWIGSGLASLGPGYASGSALMKRVGSCCRSGFIC